MKQVIIARKDLNMSPGKLAAQVAHASWAFLSNQMRDALTDGGENDGLVDKRWHGNDNTISGNGKSSRRKW